IGDTVQFLAVNDSSNKVTASAASGYRFVRWEINNGKLFSKQNPLVVHGINTNIELTAVFTQTNSINKNKSITFKITPNPASNEVYLTLTEAADIVIQDQSGKVMVHKPGVMPELITLIQLENFIPGVYFMKAKTKNYVITKKLIVN
ncbi:MAG: T9SS type A sorting domain-containing protein, partial [Bacteroidales bacterium]|nr:T9SS type A sorting domain-containing protein [Bacteroidales bacterium]